MRDQEFGYEYKIEVLMDEPFGLRGEWVEDRCRLYHAQRTWGKLTWKVDDMEWKSLFSGPHELWASPGLGIALLGPDREESVCLLARLEKRRYALHMRKAGKGRSPDYEMVMADLLLEYESYNNASGSIPRAGMNECTGFLVLTI